MALVVSSLFSSGASSEEATTVVSESVERAKQMARSGRPKEAMQLLDEVILDREAAGRDDALFQKGWILLSQVQRYEDAIATFQRIADDFPESGLGDDGLYYAGFAAQYHLKNPRRALEIYRSGYARYPKGNYRNAIADKIAELSREIEGSPMASSTPSSSFASDAGALAPSKTFPPETDVPDSTPLRADTGATLLVQFENAPLRTFVQWVAEVTGRNFILDDSITGNITVYSGRPVPFKDVYRIFLSIMEVRGFAAVESGNVVKLVPRSTAAQSELPIVIDDDAHQPTDRVVTRIFRLEKLSASTVQGLIRPFLDSADQIIMSPETNSLIVTGPVRNLRRIEELVKAIEGTRTPLLLRAYKIQYGQAAQINDKVNVLMQALGAPQGAPAPVFRVLADPRTNTIHALAEGDLQLKIEAIIRELDVDKTADRLVRIFNLNYARADDVMKQLRMLLGLDAPSDASDFGGIVQTVLISDPRLNIISASTFAPRVLELIETYVKHVDRAPSNELRQTRLVKLQNANAKELAELLGRVFPAGATGAEAFTMGLADRVVISPDDRTNSLIITATSADWEKLQRLIADLDVRKAQVLVDAVILETTLDEARALGVTLTTAEDPIPGHTKFMGGSVTMPTGQIASGGLVVAAVRGTTIGSALQALLTSSRTNILQMPQVLALDNEMASISVGDLTPLVTSRSVSGDNVQISGTSSIYQNVDYKNIGLNLKLKPHVGEGNDILLEMMLEVQNRNAASEVGLPVFTNRALESKIQVRNNEYVILGGLLRTQDNWSKRETPWLSKLPVLGALFRNTTSREDKTVLLIFLRPRIVTDPEESREVSEEERMQFEAESRRRVGAQKTEMEKWIPED